MSIDDCQGIADKGLSALGPHCSQLLNINTSNCLNITDIDVSALAHGCGKLRSIYLDGRDDLTDISDFFARLIVYV